MTTMRNNTRNLLARIARDHRGVSIIETALIAPIILMLLAGMVDFAMGFSLKLKTQQAAARSIEYATTAGVENITEAGLRADAAAAAGVAAQRVTVERWLECDAERRDFEGSCDSGQVMGGRYVSVRIENAYEPMLGALLPARIATDGVFPFVGFSTVRLQ
jgi:Flp pilus assembly pilin Flp